MDALATLSRVILLVVGGAIVLALAIIAVWLMERAKAEPAARAVGRAEDPREEAEARRRSGPKPSVLAEPERD
jgi:hypothetical protein